MNFIYLIILILLPLKLFAYEELWKSGDIFVPLLKNEKMQTLVSKNCEHKKCQALKILKIISLKKINSSETEGGKNPGAVICLSIAGSKIIYLKDLHGNENSFCLFSDHSMVSNSTLLIYAQKNDQTKK